MSISALRSRVARAFLDFAWNEWAQIGVFARSKRESPWAADPEALLLSTLEVGRTDPRLFDEVLDWLALNSKLLSLQRLRNLYADEIDPRLSEAALAWAGRQAKGRMPARRPIRVPRSPERLFYAARTPTRGDEPFLEFGFVKPPTQRSGKSRAPDLRRPINFAFLLRNIFGVGSRAEVLRFLLTASVRSPLGTRPLFTTLAIAEAAGYAKRNVQETLNALVEAQMVELTVRGNERLYAVQPDRWQAVLQIDPERFPSYRDWPHALQALRVLHRWLHQPDLETFSPYMRASEARALMDRIEPVLRYAGVLVTLRNATGEEYWDVFTEAIEQILGHLASGLPW